MSSWQFPIGGNWSIGAFWSGGEPNSTTDVDVFTPGTYTITLNSFGNTNSLTLNSYGATISETSQGYLSTNAGLNIEEGTLILQGSNFIQGGINFTGGELEIGSDPNALAGGSNIVFSGNSELLGLATTTVTNALGVNSGSPVIAAATGTDLTLDGTYGWTMQPGSIIFGDGTNNGTVTWFTPAGSSFEYPSEQFYVFVDSGTLKAGDNDLGLLLSKATEVGTQGGSTIDLAGFNTEIGDLQGLGTIGTSSGTPTLLLEGGTFGGQITGKISLDVEGSVSLTGANTYTGGTTIESNGILSLGNQTPGGSIVGNIVDNGILEDGGEGAITLAGTISGVGGIDVSGGGTMTLSHSNTYAGGTELDFGTLAITKASALGSGEVDLYGGELLALNGVVMTNALVLGGGSSATLAGATGDTLKMDASSVTVDSSILQIGDGTNDGTVVWESSTVSNPSGPFDVLIDNATLVQENSTLRNLLAFGQETNLLNGTIDIDGIGTVIGNLAGTGTIANSGSAVLLAIFGGDLDGSIEGKTFVQINNNFVLDGASTYTGGTTIESSAVLNLGDGTTDGTILGSIFDDGTLVVDDNSLFVVGGGISGAGQLLQLGSGTTVLSYTDSYSGGTTIGAGVLQITKSAALAAGALTMDGGELLGAALPVSGQPTPHGITFTATDSLSMTGTDDFSAGSGDVLRMEGQWTLAPDTNGNVANTIRFGDGTNDGTVTWYSPAGSSIANSNIFSVDVNSGTLKAGDAGLGMLLSHATLNEIDAAGILDVAGFPMTINNLYGMGTLEDSGGKAVTLTLVNGDFSGLVKGSITLDIEQQVTLDGKGTFTLADILNQSQLTLGGAAHENVSFDAFGVNETLALEKGVGFTGAVSGFGYSDTIDVQGVSFGTNTMLTYNTTTNVLTVTDGTHSVNIAMAGAYTQGSFLIGADSGTGTDITFNTAAAIPANDSFDFSQPKPTMTTSSAHAADQAAAVLADNSAIHGPAPLAPEIEPHSLSEILDHLLVTHHSPAFYDFAFA